MEALVSLESYDPELREYLQRHRWPSVMEVEWPWSMAVITCTHHAYDFILQALLTGLAVMTPRDPWQFVSQSLRYIQQTSITAIPRWVRPAVGEAYGGASQ